MPNRGTLTVFIITALVFLAATVALFYFALGPQHNTVLMRNGVGYLALAVLVGLLAGALAGVTKPMTAVMEERVMAQWTSLLVRHVLYIAMFATIAITFPGGFTDAVRTGATRLSGLTVAFLCAGGIAFILVEALRQSRLRARLTGKA